MTEYKWTFPPELLIQIIQDVIDGRSTRKEGKQRIREYLNATYPHARKAKI